MLHNKFQSISLNLRNNLINATNQANRVKVSNLNNSHFLRNKGNEGHIQAFDEFATFMEPKKHLHNIFFDSIPARLEESRKKKTIWTWHLIPIQLFYPFEYLPLLENSLHPNSLLLTKRVERKTIQIWRQISFSVKSRVKNWTICFLISIGLEEMSPLIIKFSNELHFLL
jgi:hypothetical protein